MADPPVAAVCWCGNAMTNGFCLPCYERVAKEKPLELWVRYGGSQRKCRNCARSFTPAARNYIHCPECWAQVGKDYLKKKYGNTFEF